MGIKRLKNAEQSGARDVGGGGGEVAVKTRSTKEMELIKGETLW
jgi:hypothetical protein